MEKVYGNVRPLPKEKGTRRRRRSDRRNRAQAQAVVTTMPAGDEAASQYDAVLAEAAAASVGESVSAYAEDVIIDVEILPDTGDVAVPGVFAFEAAPAAESVSAAPVSVALPAAPRVRSGFRYGCYLFVKRAFDIVASLTALVLLSWLILICLLVKWLEDFHNPVYVSERVGKNGKIFKFYKIRTMCKNAEGMKKDLIAQGLNEADGPAFKMKNDPRITRFGKFLRKTSLDELLQLINILNGSMSVVGPRPPIPMEVEQYDEYQKHRLDVKGGLLCLWQIQKNRNSLSFDEWMRLDIEYINRRSVWLDLKIIFKGAFMVIFDRSGE